RSRRIRRAGSVHLPTFAGRVSDSIPLLLPSPASFNERTPDFTISSGERQSSTLNLAGVKKKCVHRVSTVCPPRARPGAHALRGILVRHGPSYDHHADRAGARLRTRSRCCARPDDSTTAAAAVANTATVHSCAITSIAGAVHADADTVNSDSDAGPTDADHRPRSDARRVHRDRARGAADDPGTVGQLRGGALSGESGLRAAPASVHRPGQCQPEP